MYEMLLPVNKLEGISSNVSFGNSIVLYECKRKYGILGKSELVHEQGPSQSYGNDLIQQP